MSTNKTEPSAVNLVDAAVQILNRQKRAGTERVYVSPDQLEEFMRPDKTATAPARPAREQPETPVRGPMPAAERLKRAAPAKATEISQTDNAAVKLAGWSELRQTVGDCSGCALAGGRTNAVFGEGNEHAELMFIGEGPGAEEDAQGRPFVGAAGQLLTKMINAMQFSREEVYIANIVKCRPPNNRVPNEREAAACLPYLKRQIELIKPKVIVLLGATPLLYLLGKSGITRLHGTWFEYEGIPVMPTFHPAFLLRDARSKPAAWDDLKKVMIRLGKDPSSSAQRQ